MSNCLGDICLGDNESLKEIVEELGYSTDLSSDLPYYDLDEVWYEAEKKIAESGSASAEVEIEGTDFIIVYKIEGE